MKRPKGGTMTRHRLGRRGAVGGAAAVAAVLFACSAAFACQTFAGDWTWTSNASSGNTVNTVGGNNSSSCDGNISHHHQGATTSTPLPSINAPAGTAAVDLTVSTAPSSSCLRNDATLCPAPNPACNKVKDANYELHK
jgi:hypothetical protein